jgi:hypothetical protein
VRFSTKGSLLQTKEYLDAMRKRPELFWVAFSIITPDDEILKKIDKYAPDATQRLKTMKALSDIGVKTSLRYRPIIPNISDRTRNYPKAYKSLIEKAAESGAVAVSMEALFSPSALSGDAKERWAELCKVANTDLLNLYKRITPKFGKCIRPSRAFVEDIFLASRDIAHANKMVFASSDPTMKHLNDTGCCCGMLPDDPIFGNWQRENACNAIVEARDNSKLINGKDYIPEWSKTTMVRDMCMCVGAMGVAMANTTWADKLLNGWNDLKTNRGTFLYFQGILKPDSLDAEKNVIYKYSEPLKSGCKTPIFKI